MAGWVGAGLPDYEADCGCRREYSGKERPSFREFRGKHGEERGNPSEYNIDRSQRADLAAPDFALLLADLVAPDHTSVGFKHSYTFDHTLPSPIDSAPFYRAWIVPTGNPNLRQLASPYRRG
jgi:hypothetical protein